MASEEHLALLKRGMFVWNRWRKKNPEIQPDLREADLRGMTLPKFINLAQADLSRANLAGAISSADFTGAKLTGANLSKANLICKPP